jgi:hypothetical protein
MTNILSEKERELEEAKNLEMFLNAKYQEEEEETDLYMKELENIYIETLQEVEMIKKENIEILKNNSRHMQKVFDNLKNFFIDV